MATVGSDRYTCRMITPSVVLDHRLDGEGLARVRDHLRSCELCRERVERLQREEGLAAGVGAMPATPVVPASLRPQASPYRGRAIHSRRYATVGLMATLLAGLFVLFSLRYAADALKGSGISSTLLATGSVEGTMPSTEPSPSATSEPSALPATPGDRTVLTVVVPSAHRTPAPRPASTPAPRPASTPAPVDARPAVILTVTPRSGLAPLTVTADASRSTDTDATGIASYDFDFGDGTPHAWGAAAQHKYCVAGIYRLTVVVTDTAGLRSSAFVYVAVTKPINQIFC